MTLPEIAVKKPIATLMLLLSILVLGLIALTRLDLAFMPEKERKRLIISAAYPNASAKILEKIILKPMEDALSSLNGLEGIRSNADPNGTRIYLYFDYQQDMDFARAEAHERLDRIKSELPEDLERITVSSHWNAQETGETILEARLSSNKDLSENYALLDRKIIRPLSRIPGVAVAQLDGVNPKEIRVALDLNKLKQHKIDPRSVWRDVISNNQNASIGILRVGKLGTGKLATDKLATDERKIALRTLGTYKSIEEIRRQPISNTHLKVGDVAEVVYQQAPLEYGRHIDGKFAVGLSIAKESSAKTIQVTEAVKAKIDSMQYDAELDGIQVLVWEDQGKEIKKTLNELQRTGIFGAILASIVLFVFLRKLSTTIVAVLCIPFSVIVACGVIWLQGKSLNTISLLGLIVGIGMLVDNAVVIMENIDRYQKKGYAGRVAAILGSKEVSVAVITATATSLIVFLPLIFTQPTEMNVLFKELGITICITLLASLLISQTLIPLASSKLLRTEKTPSNSSSKASNGLMQSLQNYYEKILVYTLKHRRIVIFITLLIASSIYYPVSNMNFNFSMSSSESFVGVRVAIDSTSSLIEKEKIISQIESVILPHKEALNVEAIYCWWNDRHSIMRLYMKSGYKTEEAMDRVRKQLPEILPTIAGVELDVEDNTPFWRRNVGKRIDVSLEGNDSDELAKLGRLAVEKIENIQGLFNAYSTGDDSSYELQALLDRERMFNYSIDSSEPANLVEMTFRGRNAGHYRTADGEVDIRVMPSEELQTRISDVKDLAVTKSDGSSIALDNIASISLQKSKANINREDKISSINVGARYESGKKNDFRDKMIASLQTIPLPQGYRWNFAGRNYQVDRAEQEFLVSFILAFGLIFAVMAGLFESMRQALALMISLPFALVGASWALYFLGIDVDQPAMIAVLLLLGIVVNNGIVMIEHINLYRRNGIARTQAMLRGGKERLRPIVMTVLTTMVGLIPIMIQKPALAGVYYYSMAYVIMGGLLFSTLLTTIFLPATISLIEDVGDKFCQMFTPLTSRTVKK